MAASVVHACLHKKILNSVPQKEEMYESGSEDDMRQFYNNRSPHEGQIESRSVTVSLQAGHGSENGAAEAAEPLSDLLAPLTEICSDG